MSQEKVLDAERGASYRFVDQVLRENKDHVFVMQFDLTVQTRQILTSSDLHEPGEGAGCRARGELSFCRPGTPREQGPCFCDAVRSHGPDSPDSYFFRSA